MSEKNITPIVLPKFEICSCVLHRAQPIFLQRYMDVIVLEVGDVWQKGTVCKTRSDQTMTVFRGGKKRSDH